MPYRQNIPIYQIFDLFGTSIIAHFLGFVNMYSEIYQITFLEVEKSLPCVKGGGTRSVTEGL